jgi:hypothetical protein
MANGLRELLHTLTWIQIHSSANCDCYFRYAALPEDGQTHQGKSHFLRAHPPSFKAPLFYIFIYNEKFWPSQTPLYILELEMIWHWLGHSIRIRGSQLGTSWERMACDYSCWSSLPSSACR